MNRQGMKSLLSDGHGSYSNIGSLALVVKTDRATRSAEQALSLILVSLPILRPLFRNFLTPPKSARSPLEAPTIGHKFQRRPPPDYLLLKRTTDDDSRGGGRNGSYAIPPDESANRSFPQMPLAACHVERPTELDVRAT